MVKIAAYIPLLLIYFMLNCLILAMYIISDMLEKKRDLYYYTRWTTLGRKLPKALMVLLFGIPLVLGALITSFRR